MYKNCRSEYSDYSKLFNIWLIGVQERNKRGEGLLPGEGEDRYSRIREEHVQDTEAWENTSCLGNWKHFCESEGQDSWD